MVLTVSFVVSPETGLCCLRRQQNAKHPRRLDASVGASERYDFAVRDRKRLVFAHASVHRIPRPTFVTIAKRPSDGCGTGEGSKDDLPDGESKIF